MAGADSVFGDLRKLADWFSTSPQRGSLQIERTVQRLGSTAIPLLGRELRSPDSRRREASRNALTVLADDVLCRARVVAELRTITEGDSPDDVKVCALGLLSELGERSTARFADPSAIQARSAIALAAQLSSEADVASAADLMVRQLEENDIVQMLEVMIGAAPVGAQRLAAELAVRLDLPAETRERITGAIIAHGGQLARSSTERRKSMRATQVAVLVDASARLVVVASRKVIGERRYRRWAVLIGSSGRIDDCLHEDDGGEDGDAAPLIASLCADGYRVASSEIDHARTVITAAARVTAMSPANGLPSAYYLGRDLLDLGDAHVGGRPAEGATTLARALEYLAEGDPARAETLLARCDAENPEVAAATAVILLGKQRYPEALEAIERALAIEPGWPLHHWNHAAVLHQLGDPSGCFHALRRFVSTSANPSGLYADPDQPGRVASAERMMTELERTARVSGTSLRRRRRRTTTKKSRART